MLTRIIFVVLIAFLAVSVAGDLHPAEARKKRQTRVITRQFSSLDVPIAIPARPNTFGIASPFPSAVQIGGFRNGKVRDVNLILAGLSHDVPTDIDIALVAPGGRTAQVLSDVATSQSELNGLTLTLDDQAGGGLPAVASLIPGSFQPRNFVDESEDLGDFDTPNVALATFNGLNPDGTWSLLVQDDDLADTGSLEEWSLVITAKVKR